LSDDLISAEFLSPLRDVYGPHGPQLAAALAKRIPSNMTGEALREAAEKLIRSRKASRFPTLPECLGALTAMARQTQTGASASKPSDASEAFRKRLAAIRAARESGLAERADREGWLVGLVEFYEDGGVAPERRDVDRMIAGARLCEQKADAGGVFRDALFGYLKAMRDRARRDVFAFPVAGDRAA
jgi:hypothetical protein